MILGLGLPYACQKPDLRALVRPLRIEIYPEFWSHPLQPRKQMRFPSRFGRRDRHEVSYSCLSATAPRFSCIAWNILERSTSSSYSEFYPALKQSLKKKHDAIESVIDCGRKRAKRVDLAAGQSSKPPSDFGRDRVKNDESLSENFSQNWWKIEWRFVRFGIPPTSAASPKLLVKYSWKEGWKERKKTEAKFSTKMSTLINHKVQETAHSGLSSIRTTSFGTPKTRRVGTLMPVCQCVSHSLHRTWCEVPPVWLPFLFPKHLLEFYRTFREW